MGPRYVTRSPSSPRPPAGLALLALATLVGSTACWNFDQAYQDYLDSGYGRDAGGGGGTDAGPGGQDGGSDAGPGGGSDAGSDGGSGGGQCGNGLCLEGSRRTLSQNGLFAVWGPSANSVFMGGGSGVVLTWDGNTFNERQTGIWSSLDIYSLGGTSPGDVWAAGGSGLIVHWDGGSWFDEHPTSTNPLSSVSEIYAPRPGIAWLAAYDGVYVWLEDGGTGPQAMAIDTWNSPNTVTGIWGTGNRFWAVGTQSGSSNNAGIVWTSTDGGFNGRDGGAVDPVVYSATFGLNVIHGTADNNVWAAGANGTALHLTDAGWSPVSVPNASGNFWGVWASATGEVWLTNYTPTVYKHELDGGWSLFTPPGADGISLTAVYGFDSTGELWFVGENDPNGPDAGYAFRYKRSP